MTFRYYDSTPKTLMRNYILYKVKSIHRKGNRRKYCRKYKNSVDDKNRQFYKEIGYKSTHKHNVQFDRVSDIYVFLLCNRAITKNLL